MRPKPWLPAFTLSITLGMADVAIDKVRSSRDGHQYHEAWLARRALGLLFRQDGLCAIAVEGLSEEDEGDVGEEAVEIADATFYFGEGPSFERCDRIEIAQFKYSIARANTDFRFTDAQKTLKKFATTDSDFVTKHGATQTSAKLRFAIVTNRPIANALVEALDALAASTQPPSVDGKAQYKNIVAKVGLPPDRLKDFAARISLTGRSGNLQTVEATNARIIADWSASNDAIARARLGDLRKLIRDKAGSIGQKNNRVTTVDVLAALDLADESALLPTPEAFPEPGPLVEREQLSDFIGRLAAGGNWLVHAAGGIGKTVFVETVASRLSNSDAVVVFDCFGGGAYRSPVDGRHRPERGLLHIVNELACRGLCDPILPGSGDPSEVIRRSLQRFSQAIVTLRRTRPKARLVIIIDAADNAAIEAKDRGQPSFPRDLLESLSHGAPIEGLVLILTARTERRDMAIGHGACTAFALLRFSVNEARSFITVRRPEVTPAQADALYRRSDGNPRVLANLIEPDRSLVGDAETEAKVELPTLIEERIARGVSLADAKGARTGAVSAFLCALSVLPPPVPIREAAIAFGIPEAEVESFAADLAPLLERTRHGLIFRDEPTETLVRTKYGSQLGLLNDVVVRLTAAQSTSAYAARALPALLFAMGKVDELRALAFDARFPPGLDSEVAKRGIRIIRLRTALGAAARAKDHDAVVDLLVELSSLAAVDERGEDFLLANPDLVVALGDPEALRRLFEVRGGWPGTRHARLAIAYTADGDTAEAYGHALRADEWLRWYHRQDNQTRMNIRPATDNYAVVPFFLLARNQPTRAAAYIARWNAGFGYKISRRFFEYCAVAIALNKLPGRENALRKLIRCPKAPPALIAAAFWAHADFDDSSSRRLLHRLASALPRDTSLADEYHEHNQTDSYRDALLRCGARAAQLGLEAEAITILTFAAPRHYDLWALQNPWSMEYIAPWLFLVAAQCASRRVKPSLIDCLPSELSALVRDAAIPDGDAAQQALVEQKIGEESARAKKDKVPSSDRYQFGDKLRSRVLPLLDVVRDLSGVIAATDNESRQSALTRYFDGWKTGQADARSKGYYDSREKQRFLDSIYAHLTAQSLAVLGVADGATAQVIVDRIEHCEFIPITTHIELVRQFSAHSTSHPQAGTMAKVAVKIIESEADIEQRSNLLAQTARAILAANRAEAAHLLKQGLTNLDAIGSGDHQYTWELLSFAGALSNDQALSPHTALRLAKICELNVYDSHKFPWPSAALAFSRVWGPAYLAQIARWHDRDKADLELTLPPALTFLVRDGKIAPADAIALMGLTDPAEAWDWRWSNFAEAIIDAKPVNLAELLDSTLDQFERAYPVRMYENSLRDIRLAVEKDSQATEQTLARMACFDSRAELTRRVKPRSHSSDDPPVHTEEVIESKRKQASDAEQALVGVDPTRQEDIETLVDALDNLHGALDLTTGAFSKLRFHVPYGDRDKHIKALVAARNLNLFEKNALLEDVRKEWLSDSPTSLAVIQDASARIIDDHAAEIMGSDWGFNWELKKAAKITERSLPELAIRLVEAATSRDLTAAATAWLNLATILAPQAQKQTPLRALARLLDSGAARLADEIGDGPWREELDAGSDPVAIAAGLVWFCLGSPDASSRWRAAHVVRTLAQLDRWPVIDTLLSKLNDKDAGAFQDRSLPFFAMHAKLWLLMAAARLAMDYPEEIRRHQATLETIALDDAFPNVALRENARRALLSCFKGAKDRASKALVKRLARVNVSQFPKKKEKAKREPDFQWERPETEPEPEPEFHFEYDFEKYNLESLGTIFGLPKWKIGDLCVHWIRQWSPTVKSMHDFAGRQGPSGPRDYNAGTGDRLHSYGTYLAWHALATVGGQLLLERPITRDSYYDDPWEEWRAKYAPSKPDGLWLSDGTGKYPNEARHELLAADGEKKPKPTNDAKLLYHLAGFEDSSRLGPRFTVFGSWESPDHVSVWITSALVPHDQTRFAGLALATSPPFHMTLPLVQHYDEEDGRKPRDSEAAPCEGWTTLCEAELKLDERDPFGTRAALARPRPTKWIIDAFKLSVSDPWNERWLLPGGRIAFHAAAWGCKRGQGENEVADDGNAILCDREFLATLLSTLDRDLLVLVKLRHYRQKDRYSTDPDDADDSFSHSFAIAAIDPTLKVTLIEAVPEAIEAVEALDEHSRYRFDLRFRAIKKALGAVKRS